VSVITFDGDLPDKGAVRNILSDVYMEYVQWTNESYTIALKSYFSAKTVNTLILGDCTAEGLQLDLFSDGALVYTTGWIELNRRLAPDENSLDITDQNIFIRHFSQVEADALELNLASEGMIKLHKLYMGGRESIRTPANYEYPIIGNGQGKRSDIGVAYGYKMDTLRILKAHWDFIDDTDRRVVERVLDRVQNVDPCYIQPCSESEYIPPMFGVFKQEMGNKKKLDRWQWEGLDLEFTQVT
jgi:hypothetical protein